MLLLKVYADADCDNIVILVDIDRDMIYLVPNLHLGLPLMGSEYAYMQLLQLGIIYMHVHCIDFAKCGLSKYVSITLCMVVLWLCCWYLHYPPGKKHLFCVSK